MRLLSRNAEGLFWLARYLERAASLARVIEMQSSFGSDGQETNWAWLLKLHADETRFKDRYELSAGNIVEFYVLDIENPSSIRSSLHWARENARTLRPFIPQEMWVQLNDFHATIARLGAQDIDPAQLARSCSAIRAGCLAQVGIAEGTLFRDEGYSFFRLGQIVERADQTSRLLDVKAAQAASGEAARDPSGEFMFWGTILRTASAYQAFHRLDPGGPEPERVVRFLILNPSHPRSIGFCVREIESVLHDLRGGFKLRQAGKALESCEKLMLGLQAAAADERLEERLHDFNDWIQRSLIELTEHVSTAFFLVPAPGSASGAASNTQKQTQAMNVSQDHLRSCEPVLDPSAEE